MDECYLCKDVLVKIIALSPRMYSVFLRLCRDGREMVRKAGIDAGDALVAQNMDVVIKNDCILWYKNGLLHRDFRPAVTTYNQNGSVHDLKYYRYGMRHRDGDLPAVVRFIYINGRNMPFSICYYKHHKLHRRGKKPVDLMFGKTVFTSGVFENNLHVCNAGELTYEFIKSEYNKAIAERDGF